jgi:hypothetical protein
MNEKHAPAGNTSPASSRCWRGRRMRRGLEFGREREGEDATGARGRGAATWRAPARRTRSRVRAIVSAVRVTAAVGRRTHLHARPLRCACSRANMLRRGAGGWRARRRCSDCAGTIRGTDRGSSSGVRLDFAAAHCKSALPADSQLYPRLKDGTHLWVRNAAVATF